MYMRLDSRVGPLVLGNLLVPEALAGPEARKNNSKSMMQTDMSCKMKTTLDDRMVQHIPSHREVLVGRRFLSYPEGIKRTDRVRLINIEDTASVSQQMRSFYSDTPLVQLFLLVLLVLSHPGDP